MTRKQPKTEFFGIRMSLFDVAALRAEATPCGMTMSELVRRQVKGQLVTTRPIRRPGAASIGWGAC